MIVDDGTSVGATVGDLDGELVIDNVAVGVTVLGRSLPFSSKLDDSFLFLLLHCPSRQIKLTDNVIAITTTTKIIITMVVTNDGRFRLQVF